MKGATALMTTGAALVLLVGCGGGDGEAPAPRSGVAPVSDETALESAARAYSAAVLEPDATAAYALLSPHCQDVYSVGQLAGLRVRVSKMAIRATGAVQS